MKRLSRKRFAALAAAVLVLVLLLAALCVSCRQGQSGDDPTVTDTEPFAESVTPGPEQETPAASAEGDTSEPTLDESGDTADTADSPETQAPSLQETSDKSETDSTVEPDTSHEEPAFPPSPTYEEYCAMTSQEQVDFFNSFDRIEDYFLWFEAAKKDYEDRHPGIEIGPDGVIIP